MTDQSAKDQKEFQEYYMISSLPSMRIGLLFTLIMFFCFVLFNKIFFPNSPELQFYNRFAVISPFIAISIIVTYIRRLHKWLHPIYIVLNLLIIVAVFYVGYESNLAMKGYEYYFSWVMLVVIGLFVFFRLPFRTLIIIGSVQLLAYLMATILNGTLAQNSFLFFSHLFFVIAMYATGCLMAYMLRNINLKDFIHQKELAANNMQLTEEIKVRKLAVKAYQQSEIQYHNTLDSIPDWIYVVDRDFRIVIINSALREGHNTGGLPVDVVGKHVQEVYPFMTSATIDDLQRVFDSGEISHIEQQMTIDSRVYHMENRKVPIFKNNEIIQVMTILRDRSKEKEVEELKQRNSEQKEIMLREIHHRVKNNLAIVISLLDLQLRNNAYPELNRIIRDIEMRIRSMALIHEHLYRSDNLDLIPLGSYLHSLATIITSTFSGNRVTIVTDLDQADVSIETALPVGLIANELLTNAFKYAFPGNREGVIHIILRKDTDEIYTLTIKDNGVGLPDNFSLDSEKSLGMFIVRLLTEQLDGELAIDRQEGTTFVVRFRNLTFKNKTVI